MSGDFPKELIKSAQIVPISELNEGDVLVLTVDRFLKTEQREALIKGLRQAFPNGKLIVLDPGMKIEVIKKGDVNESPAAA